MPIRHRAVFFLCAGLAGLAGSASGGAASEASDELRALKAYGAANKTCDGWTDSCALCVRRADGTLGCSRLGVECEIAEIQCTQKARDPGTGKTPPPDEPR